MRKRISFIAFASLMVSSCAAADGDPMAGGGGLNGDWSDQRNGYEFSFRNGRLTGYESSGGVIAWRGDYIALSRDEVEITLRGEGDRGYFSVRCSRPDAGSLNCAGGELGSFFLLRR